MTKSDRSHACRGSGNWFHPPPGWAPAESLPSGAMTGFQARMLVIAGPPAAGKSTVAHLVALGAARPTVHVPTDCLHTWIKSGFVLPFLHEGAHQNDVVQRAMLAIAGAYAEGGY